MAVITGAHTLIRNGFAQNDIDMDHHRLINLDTSNLPPSGIPPTIVCPANQWLDGWDSPSRTWHSSEPSFLSLSGNLTLAQQQAITQVGTLLSGEWRASIIQPQYLPTLDLINRPVNNLDLNGRRIVGLADPIAATDAVNKRFMDLLLQGLNPKQAVRAASTTRDVIGEPIIDGVTLVAGDRVLMKNYTGAQSYHNGIYVFQPGPAPWPRATDADSADELKGAYCNVLEGDTQSGTNWVQVHTLTDPIGVGDDILFVLFSNSSDIEAGAGLEKDGNTLNVLGTAGRIKVNGTVDIDPAYVGQTSITTLGTIGIGIWESTEISPEHG